MLTKCTGCGELSRTQERMSPCELCKEGRMIKVKECRKSLWFKSSYTDVRFFALCTLKAGHKGCHRDMGLVVNSYNKTIPYEMKWEDKENRGMKKWRKSIKIGIENKTIEVEEDKFCVPLGFFVKKKE